jgi:uncharacterized membrane protein
MAVRDDEIRRAPLGFFNLIGRSFSQVEGSYWLFVGITAVGVVLAQLVPFVILLGPMACGIALAHRKKEAGEEVEFGDLFRGFDWFLPSLLVALLRMGIVLAFAVPLYVVLFFLFLWMGESLDHGDDESVLFAGILLAGLYLLLSILCWILYAIFFYVFPLIMDRGLTASEAIGASWRGFRKNMIGTLLLTLGSGLLLMLGACCCYVGLFFVLPFTTGVGWLAYREVFEKAPESPEQDPLFR